MTINLTGLYADCCLDQREVFFGYVAGVEALADYFVLFFAVEVGCQGPAYAFGYVARVAVFGYVACDFVVDYVNLSAPAERYGGGSGRHTFDKRASEGLVE